MNSDHDFMTMPVLSFGDDSDDDSIASLPSFWDADLAFPERLEDSDDESDSPPETVEFTNLPKDLETIYEDRTEDISLSSSLDFYINDPKYLDAMKSIDLFSLDNDEDLHREIESRQEKMVRVANEVNSNTDEDIANANFEIERILEKYKDAEFEVQDDSVENISIIFQNLNKLSNDAEYTSAVSSTALDKTLSHIERLVAMIVCASDASNYKVFAAAIFAYVSSYCEGSVLLKLKKYITECISMEAQSDEPDSEGWLASFRHCTKNYQYMTKLPAWKHIHKILTACISVGLCEASDCEFKIGTMKLFSFQTKNKSLDAVDLLDAIFQTADYFIEAGYEAFSTGSLRPFLFDSKNVRILDEAFYAISMSMRALPTGDLIHTPYKSMAELSHVIENTLLGYQVLKEQCKDRLDKRDLSLRCEKLQQWRLDFIQQSAAGGLREAPYSLYLVGAPGIGKSMMTQVMIETVMKANNIPFTPEQIATVNPSDKFASTVRNDTLVVILDDFGNFVLEFENDNPLKYIIEICNNVISYVPKAEAADKGKVVWRPTMVVTTSNLDNLLFNKLSNEPGSAYRRGLRIKPFLFSKYAENFRFSRRKYEAINGEIGPTPHAYDFNIREWGGKHWVPKQFEGDPTTDMSYSRVCKFLMKDSKEHFIEQKKLVKDYKNIGTLLTVCPHDDLKHNCLICTPEEEKMETQAGIVDSCSQLILDLRAMTVQELSVMRTQYDRYSFLSCSDFLPDFLAHSEIFSKILLLYYSRSIIMRIRTFFCLFCVSFLFFFLVGARGGLAINLCVVWPYLLACTTSTHVQVLQEFRDRRSSLPATFTNKRDEFLKGAFAASVFLSGMYSIIRMYRTFKKFEPQGNIAPTSHSEMRERDKEVNPWKQFKAEPLPSQDKSKCVTPDVLENKVWRNQVHVARHNPDNKRSNVNGLFISANEVLLPLHFINEGQTTYTFTRTTKDAKGSSFTESFSRDDVVAHPEYDVAYVQIASTSPFADLTGYLAKDTVPSAGIRLLYRNLEKRCTAKGRAYRDFASNGFREFLGYKYELDMNTFKGLCNSTIISETKDPMIIGLHIGGIPDSKRGCATPLTASIVWDMRAKYFAKHPSALKHANEGEVFETQMGVNWYEGPEIHSKSPLHYIPEHCNIRAFGSCKGRSTYYSSVVQTPISQKVDELFGNEQQYAGPKFHRWKSWYESLVHSSCPAFAPSSVSLDWAVNDYMGELDKIFEIPGVYDEIRPMTNVEIVSGKDGFRFIDPVNGATSPGFPLQGRKDDLIEFLEPTEDHMCPRTFIPIVWEEYAKFEEVWATGTRAYPVFKACLKDEATKVEKTKVRVFQGAPLVLQIPIRKYFLPIARQMSMSPLKSECAVGINAQSPEWDQLQKHITKFGKKRILAGDFPKYDLRMSAKLTSAAFKIMIAYAEKSGNYTERDLTIMRSVATEVCYPMMSFNGDLIMLQGSNPSGQNLTVYINSIVNSLIHRIAFYLLGCGDITFAEACALITYGDDFKGSVSEKFDIFNNISSAGVLDHYDLAFTSPDKESELQKYMEDKDADFLKRKNVSHEVGCDLGALDVQSMIKCLKAVVKSKAVSIEEQVSDCITGVAHESFFHGREYYDEVNPKLKELAAEAEVTHMVPALQMSFDDRMLKWKQQYENVEVPIETPNDVEVFEMQSSDPFYGPPVSEVFAWKTFVLYDFTFAITVSSILYLCIFIPIWLSYYELHFYKLDRFAARTLRNPRALTNKQYLMFLRYRKWYGSEDYYSPYFPHGYTIWERKMIHVHAEIEYAIKKEIAIRGNLYKFLQSNPRWYSNGTEHVKNGLGDPKSPKGVILHPFERISPS